uniref:Uncharacterized protein n=1 Tax=Quercus lobata TaxID=97700 RepID=A0A7N2M4S9_QUELO
MEREAGGGGYRGRGRGRERGRGRGGGDRGGRGGARGSAAGEGAGRRGGRGPPWHGATQVWSEQQQQQQQQQSPRPRQPQPQPPPHVGVGGGGGPPGSQWVGPTSEGSSWASKVGGASGSGSGSSGGRVVRGQGDNKWVEVGRAAPSIPSQPPPPVAVYYIDVLSGNQELLFKVSYEEKVP